MANSDDAAGHSQRKVATRTSIVLAFTSVYFFWGSTYTAIRIGSAQMAGAAAGRDAVSDCRRDSAGVVPLARNARGLAA